MTSQSQAGPKPFVFGAERSTSTSSSPGKQQKFFDCLEEQSQKHGPSSAKSTSPVPANVTLQTGNGEAEERPPSSGPARTFDNPFETTVDKFNRIGNILEPFNIIGPPTRSGAAPSSLFGKPPPSEPGVAANASEGYERTGGLFGLFGAPRPSTPVLSKPPSSDPDNSASSLFSHPPPAPTSGGLFPPSAALNKHEHRGVGSGQPDTHEPQAQTGENAPFEFNRPPDTHGPQAQTGKDAPFVFNLPPDTHGPQAQTGKNAPFVFNRPPSAASNKHGNQGAGFGQPDTHGPQAQLGENAPFVFSRPPDTHGPEAQTGKNAPFVFNRPPSPSGSTSSPLFGNPHPPNNGQAPVAPSEGMSFFGSARSPDSGNGPHSLFGHAPPTQASGGLFSASTPTQTPGGLFSGSKPARTSGGLFSASNPAQTSGGLFSASTPAQASGGLFSASKPAQASDDLFSASTPAQTSGGLFSASTPAQTYAGLFSASTPAQTSGGLFSPSTPAQTYAGLFSASTPAQTSGGLSSALTPNKHENQGVGLGQPSTHGLSAQSGSVPSSTFGGIPPPQSGNICSSIFGNLLSNSVPGNGLFGSYNPPSEYAPGKGLFGNVNPPPARGGLFGSDNTPSAQDLRTRTDHLWTQQQSNIQLAGSSIQDAQMRGQEARNSFREERAEWQHQIKRLETDLQEKSAQIVAMGEQIKQANNQANEQILQMRRYFCGSGRLASGALNPDDWFYDCAANRKFVALYARLRQIFSGGLQATKFLEGIKPEDVWYDLYNLCLKREVFLKDGYFYMRRSDGPLAAPDTAEILAAPQVEKKQTQITDTFKTKTPEASLFDKKEKSNMSSVVTEPAASGNGSKSKPVRDMMGKVIKGRHGRIMSLGPTAPQAEGILSQGKTSEALRTESTKALADLTPTDENNDHIKPKPVRSRSDSVPLPVRAKRSSSARPNNKDESDLAKQASTPAIRPLIKEEWLTNEQRVSRIRKEEDETVERAMQRKRQQKGQ